MHRAKQLEKTTRKIEYNALSRSFRFRNYLDLRDVYAFRNSKEQAVRNRIFEKILKRHLPLILGEISKVRIQGYEYEDIKQEGCAVLFYVVKQDYRLSSRNPFWYFLRLCLRRKLYSLMTSANTKKNSAFHGARRFEDISQTDTQEYLDTSIIPKVDSHENSVVDRLVAKSIVKELKHHLSDLEYKAFFEKNLNDLTYKQITEKYGFNSKMIDNAINRVTKKIARFRVLAS